MFSIVLAPCLISTCTCFNFFTCDNSDDDNGGIDLIIELVEQYDGNDNGVKLLLVVVVVVVLVVLVVIHNIINIIDLIIINDII